MSEGSDTTMLETTHPTHGSLEPDSEALPLDPFTLLVSIGARWKMILASVLVAAALAVVGGLYLGSKTYTTETVLMFISKSEVEGELVDNVALSTYMNLVKIPENLEKARERVGMAAPVQALGAAVDVRIQPSTRLLIIRSSWKSSQGAASIANAVRDVFFEKHIQLLYEDEKDTLTALLRSSQERLDTITKKMSQLTGLERQIRDRVTDELRESPEMEGLGDVNIRIERLRQAIYDDQKQRANLAELAKAEIEYNKAQDLASQGIISGLEVDRRRALYDKFKAMAVDTEQIEVWRQEMEKLQEVTMPANSATSPSAPVLQDMLLQDFNLRLERIELEEKVTVLTRKLAAIDYILTSIAGGEDGGLVSEASELTQFRVVSPADPPVFPIESNRKMIAIGIFVVVAFAGFVLAAAAELLDTRVKSPADAEAKLRLPVLGAPPTTETERLDLSTAGSVSSDSFRGIARRLRQRVGADGARILVTSLRENEDRSTVLAQVAAALARQGERVLVVDTTSSLEPGFDTPNTSDAASTKGSRFITAMKHLSSRLQSVLWDNKSSEPVSTLTDILLPGRDVQAGLADFLMGEVSAIDPVVYRTGLADVDIVPRSRVPFEPDAYAGERMRRFLEEASRRYSVILVESPSLEKGSDAELLARWCTAVVAVVRARTARAGQVRAALERLESYGVPLTGSVATRIEGLYRSLA